MTRLIELDPDALFDRDSAEAALASIRTELAEQNQGRWLAGPASLLVSKVQAGLGEALCDVDLLRCLVVGWGKFQEFDKLCDPERTKAGRTRHVKLGTLEQELPVDLALRLQLGPLTSPAIKLTAVFTGLFEAVECAVRDRRLTAVGGGRFRLSLALDYRGSQVCKKRHIKDYDLPAEYAFEAPGLPLWRQGAA